MKMEQPPSLIKGTELLNCLFVLRPAKSPVLVQKRIVENSSKQQ